MGVFDAAPPDATPDRPPVADQPPVNGGGELHGPATEPEAEPPVEYPALTKAVNLLLVGGARGTWNAWLTQQWDARETIRYRSWFQTPRPGDAPQQSTGLPPLVESPGPEALEDVDVVVLHAVDASKLRADFLAALA